MARQAEKIIDLIHARDDNAPPFVSFEFFPPRTDQGVTNLLARLDRMKTQNPLYVDFTWGAGGSTAELSFTLANEAHKKGLTANMHLTCTNMDESLIAKALTDCKEAGIRNICALRGDPPAGAKTWEATDDGLACALDLIRYIRRTHGDYFCLSCAAYPEGHPNRIKPVTELGRDLSAAEEGRKVVMKEGGKDVVYVCSDEDFAEELTYLKEKVDAGADFIMTQMFFDPTVFNTFVGACRAKGINVPIVPGLMCIQAAGGFGRMTGFCRSRVPADLRARIEGAADDDAVKTIGIEHGTATCNAVKDLVPGFHFYTLNLEKVTLGIVKQLGLFVESAATPKAVDAGVLLGMGNPLLDISANVPMALLEKYDVELNNAILAEEKHLPLYEELVKEHQVEYIAGGATQNAIRVAQWMLQSPGATAFIGCVGDDANAANLQRAAEADGVATHYLHDTSAPTGTCAVLINGGERSLVANLGAANEYKVAHFEAEAQAAAMEKARFFYVAGFFLTLPGGPPSLAKMTAHANATGKVMAMNLSAPFIVDFFGDQLAEALPFVDILFGNESEAAAFGRKQGWAAAPAPPENEGGGGADADVNVQDIALRASALPKQGGRSRMVVFTQGSEQTIVAQDGKVQLFDVTPLAADKLVDTNGAGDAFVGGFLSRLVLGRGVDECVAAGHHAARVVIQHSGCTFPAEPNLEELEAKAMMKGTTMGGTTNVTH